MDTLIRAPRLIDEKRVRLFGGQAVAPSVSVISSAELGGGVATAVVQDVAGLVRKVADLEQAAASLRHELSQANERLHCYENDIQGEFSRARDSGFTVGQEQGIAWAESEWRKRLEQFKGIIESAEKSREHIAKAGEDVIAEAVYAVVIRILGRPASRIDCIRRVVYEVIDNVGAASVVRLRVAAKDFELVTALIAEVFGSSPGCDVVIDGGVVLGGCIVELQTGSLDARLETQLEALRRAVMKPYSEVARD